MIARVHSRIRGLAAPPFHNRYRFGTFDKLLHLIRVTLNRISNQDNRTLHQRDSEFNKNAPAEIRKQPKDAKEAEQQFQSGQQEISNFEQGRLKRIDDVFGTRTHFHKTKPYQQRLDSEHVINIQELARKTKQPPRWELDGENPQLVSNTKIKHRRRFFRGLRNMRSYPQPVYDLDNFQQSAKGSNANAPLIKLLSQQALFTRLSLRELDLTIQSLNKQKLLLETQQGIIESEQQQQHFIYNGQVYFRPSYSLSMFRIDSDKFTSKLITSIDMLDEFLGNANSSLEELFNMDQIYACLQEFYYDERVAEFLKKIENNELEYFISKLHISPDSQHLCILIDLLGTKKEYVGLYKCVAKQEGFLPSNTLFNLKPELAVRNGGVGYFVQRSEQGVYTELVKCHFDQSAHRRVESNTAQDEGDIVVKKTQLQTCKVQHQIVYRCQPHIELQILENKQSKVKLQDGSHYVSSNILLEQYEPNCQHINNKIYLIHHTDSSQQLKMQQITGNSAAILTSIGKDMPLHAFERQSYGPITHECHEIVGVGYLVVRYQILDSSDPAVFLKFAWRERFAHFVTLVPYAGTQHHRERKQLAVHSNALIAQDTALTQSTTQQDPLLVDHTFQISLSEQRADYRHNGQLDLTDQQLIYCCPQQQYFTSLSVHTSSPTNIYLIINKSLESIYDNNTLFVYPLRKNLTPYSIYLDGYMIKVQDQHSNVGAGKPGILEMLLRSPLLPVRFEYTLWKKELTEKINQRLYVQTIALPGEEAQAEVKLKIISANKFIRNDDGSSQQPVILYLPSHQDYQLDQTVVRKLLEKGVILAQPVAYRGSFDTDMLNLLRGTKQNWLDNLQDIRRCLQFIKQTLSNRVGIYACGPATCYATLMLNIVENQTNEIFDCSVLHEGVYDLKSIPPEAKYYFGEEASIWNKLNPMEMQFLDPTTNPEQQTNHQPSSQATDIKIINLSNILFTTLQKQSKPSSRSFICKLRKYQKILYDSVYLKQFDHEKERDLYNLSYLYFTLKNNMEKQWKKEQSEKFEQVQQEGESISRDERDGKRRF